jgi:hypothetical protein
MWLLAAIVVPSGTPIPADRAVPVGSAMALLNCAAFLLSGRAKTLDRQHSIVSVLTSANGLVILWLASTGGVLPGYGISAIMLLFAFGFVARTGFIFAAWRSAVIVVGFLVAALLYRGPHSLVVDAFIFGAAVIGTLLALRLLEQSRRRVFYQEIAAGYASAIVRPPARRREEIDPGRTLTSSSSPLSLSSRKEPAWWVITRSDPPPRAGSDGDLRDHQAPQRGQPELALPARDVRWGLEPTLGVR